MGHLRLLNHPVKNDPFMAPVKLVGIARRNYLNGEQDLTIARAKYHAASGNLLNTLGLQNLDMTPPNPNTTPEEEMLTTCPPEPIALQIPDKETVFMKAKAKEDLYRQQNAPAPAAAPASATPKGKAKK